MDSTLETQALLESIELADLQSRATWRQLRTIVRLRPDQTVLPLRTRYSEDRDNLTIGLNYVSSDLGLWYTLADVLASKVIDGKTPVIDRAVSFQPGPRQAGLKRLSLLGRAAYCVDPIAQDGFKRLVDMRDLVRKTDKTASQAIKTIANSAAYGVSAEVNRDDAPKREAIVIVGPDGDAFETTSRAIEQPGQFFHPLLATLITGAARLMLAAAERVAADQGLDWVFCDTDSIAMAKPKAMEASEFYSRAQNVVDWFDPLNPYEKQEPILKIEDINYCATPGEYEPLFAFAISAKRYALFNLDIEGRPVIRKFSAHGLGHLMDPYSDTDPAKGVPDPITDVRKLGGKRWQYDFWYFILTAALAGTPRSVRRDYHPALSKPALSRYGATSPALLRWMKPFNEGKTYSAQVKPFGFMVALIAKGEKTPDGDGVLVETQRGRGRPPKTATPKPIAPFERDPAIAASRAFDRETGEAVPLSALKTYAQALQFYHASPEDKFENGGAYDIGRTERRQLRITDQRLIGKEANRVDETGTPDPTSDACVEFESTEKGVVA